MEMLPGVGGADVATKGDLHRMRSDLDAVIHREFVAQTWRLTGAMAALFAAFTAAIKL